MSKQDRTMQILCTFNGYYWPEKNGYGGTMSYSLTGCDPDMGDIVAPTGRIDIDNAPDYDHDKYHARVDITFSLAGGCTLQDGTRVPVTWAPSLSGDQGAMVLLNVDQDGKPTDPAHADDVEAIWVSDDHLQIEVDDKNEDKNYYFRPGIVVPALNNYYISVDPPLVNRSRAS